ncbi:hypothetical protein SpCBS45565_g07925 [Spizellomyces sp. 'palustris']|nr:hypothetical protein SpCBS45565_g07925 [Spizellomyces sp. 'palustris']
MSDQPLHRPALSSLSVSRAASLETGLNHSPRSSTTTPSPLNQTPSIWFSAPDLRLARAAEAETVEPESQAQQRARVKFFDEVTSTDLRRGWYPLLMAEELAKGKVIGMWLLGDPIVLWRDAEGTPVCLEDKCAHRSTPLSLGRITPTGELECAYDGWTYDSEGTVTHIPALLPDREIPTNAGARRYPTVERDGLVWVWPGEATLPAYDIHVRLPPILSPGSSVTAHAGTPTKHASVARSTDESEDEQPNDGKPEVKNGGDKAKTDKWGKVFTGIVDMDVDHSVLLECFLDYAHLPYTHQASLPTHPPKANPTPMQVDISFGVNTASVIAVINRPETDHPPVEVKFIPPCHVQLSSNIKGYKFEQTVHCVPMQPGQTRVIYRHSRNYWTWIDWIPFVGSLYNTAWLKRILGEYQILKGMQERLREGAKPWNAPIQADLLPRYYREWYKKCLTKHSPFFRTFNPGAAGDITPMMTPYGPSTPNWRAFTPPRYTLAHIPQPVPSQLGIIQAASAAAATAAVQATGGTSRRGSIANLVGVGGVSGGAAGSRRGSMM